jgi:hypothetical protein
MKIMKPSAASNKLAGIDTPEEFPGLEKREVLGRAQGRLWGSRHC